MSKRVSLILKEADEAAIAPYLDERSSSFEALRQWAHLRGGGDIRSEASALRALLHAGAEALNEAALDAAYSDLAAEFHSPAASAERKTARDRYAARS